MKGDVLDELAKDVVLGDEIGFAVDFNQDADLALQMNIGGDDALPGHARRLLAGAGDAFLAEEFLGLDHVAARLIECPLAIHHSRVGLFAKFFDEGWRNLRHTCSWKKSVSRMDSELRNLFGDRRKLADRLGLSANALAFNDGVDELLENHADGADGVVIAGDRIVDLFRVTIGVNDGNDGNL